MNERICKRCKGIINLETSTYWIKKNPKRNSYYCYNCLVFDYQDRFYKKYKIKLTFYEALKMIKECDFHILNKKGD